MRLWAPMLKIYIDRDIQISRKVVDPPLGFYNRHHILKLRIWGSTFWILPRVWGGTPGIRILEQGIHTGLFKRGPQIQEHNLEGRVTLRVQVYEVYIP